MNKFTRREILAAFLGLPVALSACRQSSVPALPEGELIGASDVLGHRLRDRSPVIVPPDNWIEVSVVIAGGGIAGLAAAWRLQRAGFGDFVLLELESEAGGTSRSGSNGTSAYPWGAHYIPAPLKDNVSLLALLGEMSVIEGTDKDGEPVIGEEFLCREPEERVFYKGRWYEGLYLHAGESVADREQFEKFNAEVARWVQWRDARGRRAFTIPVSACSGDSEVTALDRVSMLEWMTQRGFTSARLRWWVDYACRDDYGMTVEQTSAWAGLFYFCSRVPKPGVESQPLLTWPEGNGRLVRHLCDASKSRVLLGQAVYEIIPEEEKSRSRLEVIAIDQEGRASGFRADQVIFAAPQHVARHVIRPYRENPPAHLAEFQFGSWMVANLSLRDRPQPRSRRDFPLAWDNVLYESPSLGYVVATHQRGRDHGPTVFTYYYPLCDSEPRAARQRLLGMGRDAWAEVALSDLGRAHADIRGLTERLDVMRWGHAMIRPRTGFIWSLARREAARPYRSVHFAHSELSGVALFEEAFDQGIRAAEEVLRARGLAVKPIS